MSCTCVQCSVCRGRGYVYYDAWGAFLGPTDWEGWNCEEPCDVCGGTGIAEECDECLAAADEWEEDEET